MPADPPCVGRWELMFSDYPSDLMEAKAVCAGCAQAVECLAGALDRGEQYGTWGGLTAAERRAIVREIRRRVA